MTRAQAALAIRSHVVLFLVWLTLTAANLLLAIGIFISSGWAEAGWVAGFGLAAVVCWLGLHVTVLAGRVEQHHDDHCEHAWPGYRRRTPRRPLFSAHEDRDQLDTLDAMLNATKEDRQ